MPRPLKVCDECGQTKPAQARGRCAACYWRWQRSNTERIQPGTIEERLWAKVDRSGGKDACWLWIAAIGSNGYGRLLVNGRLVQAHRLTYELMVGPIPASLVVDHLCCVKRCVNPRHLEPVTNAVNIQRAVYKPTCSRGHEWSEANTYHHPNGSRRCRACHRDDEARKRANATHEPLDHESDY